jgi:hypothetical protein
VAGCHDKENNTARLDCLSLSEFQRLADALMRSVVFDVGMNGEVVLII